MCSRRIARVTACVAVSAAWLTPDAVATPVTLSVHAWSDSGPLDNLQPGAVIHFQVGVSVDPAFSHEEYPGTGNDGLASVVYDVVSDLAGYRGYVLTPLTPAASGWSELPGGSPWRLSDVTKPMYVDSGTTSYPGYYGGWGFTNSDLPTGGDVTSSPGSILSAGMLAPIQWSRDVNPSYPGQQPYARVGVGHGTYAFPDDDPCLVGLQGGFGQDISNCANPVEGDGTWLIQEGIIDTGGWEPGWYHFDLTPTNSSLLFPANVYCYEGCPLLVVPSPIEMEGDAFTFALRNPIGGDLDSDGDVDLNDFATFAFCFSGAAVTVVPPNCQPSWFVGSDLDADGDVDLADFSSFVINFTG